MVRKVARIIKFCKNCNEIMYIRPSVDARGKGKFCSPDCMYGYRSKHNTGKDAYNYKNAKTKVVCKYCGKEFEDYQSKKREFCSVGCKGKYTSDVYVGENAHNWKGGRDQARPAKYKKWADKVKERDSVCFICGSTQKLNAHHIKKWSDYPELRYDLNNGVSICKKCHIEMHAIHKYDRLSFKKIVQFASTLYLPELNKKYNKEKQKANMKSKGN